VRTTCQFSQRRVWRFCGGCFFGAQARRGGD
jgi:hypothetical protein